VVLGESRTPEHAPTMMKLKAIESREAAGVPIFMVSPRAVVFLALPSSDRYWDERNRNPEESAHLPV
jgi:hypothetical protein